MIHRFPLFLVMERLEQSLRDQQKAISALLLGPKYVSADFFNTIYNISIDMIGLSYTLIGMIDENIDKYTKEHIFLISSEALSLFSLVIPYLEMELPIFMEGIYIEQAPIQDFVLRLASYIEKSILEESFSREFILDAFDKLLRNLSYFQYINERIPRDL